MSQDERLHKLLTEFVVKEELNPSEIEINSTPTVTLVVIRKLVAPSTQAKGGKDE